MHETLTSANTAEFLRWAATTDTCAFDVETVGLDPATGRLRFAQVGDQHRAWIIHEPFKALLMHALDATRQPLAHNGLFDATWLERAWGLPMTRVVARMVDTMSVAHLYDPRATFTSTTDDDDDEDTDDEAWAEPVGLGLKELATAHVDPDAGRYEQILNEKYGLPRRGTKKWDDIWATIPDDDPDLLNYAAADVIITSALHQVLISRLTDHERTNLLPVEQRIVFEAFKIMRRGLRVDTELAASIHEGLLGVRADTDAKLAAYGLTNSDSPRQCVDALTADGAPLTLRTKSGAKSTSRLVLDGLATNGNELAHLIRTSRQSRKYASAYARPLAESGGIVHPAIRVTGIRTGRWAVSNPPIQQWPKTPFMGHNMRGMFIAEPGRSLVSADLSSIEAVVGGALTQDANILAAVGGELADKIRIYDDLSESLGVPRAKAKTIFLSGQYGSGAEKMAVNLGTDDVASVKKMKAQTFGGYWCTDPACHRPLAYECTDHREWSDGYFGGFKRFSRNITKQWNEGWTGELRDSWPGIRNPYGRWVPARAKPRTRTMTPDWFTIFNHTTQGAARDLLMRMLIDVADAGLEPWLTVHDEIIVQVDDADADDAKHVLTNLMSTPEHPLFGVPIRCEANEPAKSWGVK